MSESIESKSLGSNLTKFFLAVTLFSYPISFVLAFSEAYFGSQYHNIGRFFMVMTAVLTLPFVLSLVYMAIRKPNITMTISIFARNNRNIVVFIIIPVWILICGFISIYLHGKSFR